MDLNAVNQARTLDKTTFHSLFAKTSLGYALTTPAGVLLDCNPAFVSLLADSGQSLPINSICENGWLEQVELKRIINELHSASEVIREKEYCKIRITAFSDAELLICCQSLDNRKKQMQAAEIDAASKLAARVAHDFNNVMHSLLGFLELAVGHPAAKDDLATYLGFIREAGENAKGLIKNLQAIGQSSQPNLQPVSLNDAIKKSVGKMGQGILAGMNLTLSLDDELQPINADPIQLDQIIYSLSANAAQATESKGKLKFKTGQTQTADGTYAVLSIRDNGCGMDQATQTRMFQPFFSTRPKTEAAGLGLSTVFNLVKSHMGRIECTSKLGQGARFDIYLPVLNQAPHPDHSQLMECHGVTPCEEMILLVDDDEAILEMMRLNFAEMGLTALTAGSGEEALELVRGGLQPSMIIMDLNMPGLGGVATLNELKHINPGIPVIIASGVDSTGPNSPEELSQADAMIKKPFRLKELMSLIEMLKS